MRLGGAPRGVLLRYLSQVYRTLVQNVPRGAVDRRARRRDGILAGDAGAGRRQPRDRVGGAGGRAGGGGRGAARRHLLGQAGVPRADPGGAPRRGEGALHAGTGEEAAATVRQVDGREFTADDFEAALADYLELYGDVTFDGRARMAWNTVIEDDGPHRWLRAAGADRRRRGQRLVDRRAWSTCGTTRAPRGPLVRCDRDRGVISWRVVV